MAALVTSYSSDDDVDEYGREPAAPKRDSGVNYDNVGMDMSSSDDDDGCKNKRAGMFGSKEEYEAYKKQFSGKQKTADKPDSDGFKTRQEIAGARNSEPSRPQDSSSSSVDKSRDGNSHDSDPPTRESRDSTSRSRDSRSRSRSPKHRGSGGRRSRGVGSRSRSRSPRRRRSRSRERHRHHRRRRSKDRRHHGHGHPRRHHGDDRGRRNRGHDERRGSSDYDRGSRDHERQEARAKKLINLGLTTKEDMDVMTAGATAGPSKEMQMQAQVQKVKEITGVELPSYYNPSAINPLQYAEQIKKRKMLWSKKTEEEPTQSSINHQHVIQPLMPATTPSVSSLTATAQPRGLALLGKPKPASQQQQSPAKTSFNKWESTNLGDNQANEKFRRLMGIKGGGGQPSAPSTSAPTAAVAGLSTAPSSSTSKQMFADQEMQYERARAITHTQKGLGLGFASHEKPPGEPSVAAGSSGGIQFVHKS